MVCFRNPFIVKNGISTQNLAYDIRTDYLVGGGVAACNNGIIRRTLVGVELRKHLYNCARQFVSVVVELVEDEAVNRLVALMAWRFWEEEVGQPLALRLQEASDGA